MFKLGQVVSGWLGQIASEDKADPRPFLLPGVRVCFDPIGPKAVRAARRAVALSLRVDPADIEEAGDALSRELIRRGISAWEGIGNAAGDPVGPTHDVYKMGDDDRPELDEVGRPIVVSKGTISLFLEEVTAYEAADAAYVRPWSDREREKNGFAGSPNGTSSAATPGSATASSRVRKARTAGASRTRKAVKGVAPTSASSRRPKKAKPSGK